MERWSDNINSAKYVFILQVELLPIFSNGRMIKHGSLFKEDRTPCHTAKATQNWWIQNGIKGLRNFHGRLSHLI